MTQILETLSTLNSVSVKMNGILDDREITIQICPHRGNVYFHFTGIGDEELNLEKTSGNGVTVYLAKPKKVMPLARG